MLRKIVGYCWRLLLRIIEVRGGIMWRMAVGHKAPDPQLELLETRGDPALEAEDTERLGAGHKLVGFRDGGRVISYGWVAVCGCDVDVLFGIRFSIPNETVYLWDCFTVDDARNQGLFRRLLCDAPKRVADATYALVAVDVMNKPSRRAIGRAGFEPFFSYYGLRVFGKTVTSVALCDGRICRLRTMLNTLPQLLQR